MSFTIKTRMAAQRQHVGSVTSAEMRTKANKFLASKKKLNTLIEIVETFEVQTDSYIPSLLAIELIFTELLKHGDMYKEIIPLKPEGNSKADAHRDALRGMYEVSFRQAVSCMGRGSAPSRAQALTCALGLLRAQGRHPTELQEAGQYYFPVQMLQAIITELLSSDHSNAHLISRFQEYSACNDVVFNSWKILRNVTPRATPSDTYMKNYFELTDKLGLKKDVKSKGKQQPQEVEENKNLCEAEGKAAFHFQLVKVQRWMARCWACVSSWQLSGDCHRRALLLLLDRLLPNLPNPLLLTDFLMDSMDSGGAASMLALQGVFTLIQQHNLEYPRVYTKLYSMFEPEIFHIKHKSRLFYLTDMFLSSTHLPEALVAGFVKRLCRLALLAPPCDVTLLLHFVANLLVRHPALKRMACREEGVQLRLAASSDPYMMEECDPSLSGALQSSVWEACGLRRHAVPAVADAAARVLAAPHATMETPISELLDDTDEDLFDREMKKTYKQVFLTFSRPQSMTLPQGERLTQMWQLV